MGDVWLVLMVVGGGSCEVVGIDESGKVGIGISLHGKQGFFFFFVCLLLTIFFQGCTYLLNSIHTEMYSRTSISNDQLLNNVL